jgi:hypothetical protein
MRLEFTFRSSLDARPTKRCRRGSTWSDPLPAALSLDAIGERWLAFPWSREIPYHDERLGASAEFGVRAQALLDALTIRRR